MQIRREFRPGRCVAAIVLLLAACTLAPVLAGCSASDSQSQRDRASAPTGPVRPMEWGIMSRSGDRVRLVTMVAYCGHDAPAPYLERIDRRRHRSRLVLTMYLRFVPPETQTGGCTGEKLGITKWVRVGAGSGRTFLYDGSSSPPEPRGRAGSDSASDKAQVPEVRQAGVDSAPKARPESGDSAPRARPVEWSLFRPPQGRRITVSMTVDYCVGAEAPDPEIAKVEIEREGQRTVVTIFPNRKGAPRKGVGCAGLEVGWRDEVILPAASKGDALFDGSVTPPVRRRWP
jgi:hypothetical protein